MDISKAFRKSIRSLGKGNSKTAGWELSIRLTPNASQSKLGDVALDADGSPYVKVYVTAIPEDNKANKALIELLSKTFRIPKTHIHIVSGFTDRRKVIWFEGESCPIINK
jgi:uncharacterized protein